MALNLTLTALGALSIWLNGQPWLESGAIAVRDGGIYFSNDCSALHSADACRPMKAAPRTTHTGTDPIGSYSEVSVSWSAASTRTTTDAAAATAALMVTGLRTYASAPGVAVLTQRFPSGLSTSSHAGVDTEGVVEGAVGRTNYDDIVSAFPSLRASHQDLAVTWYEGVQLQNSYVEESRGEKKEWRTEIEYQE